MNMVLVIRVVMEVRHLFVLVEGSLSFLGSKRAYVAICF